MSVFWISFLYALTVLLEERFLAIWCQTEKSLAYLLGWVFGGQRGNISIKNFILRLKKKSEST